MNFDIVLYGMSLAEVETALQGCDLHPVQRKPDYASFESAIASGNGGAACGTSMTKVSATLTLYCMGWGMPKFRRHV